LDHVSLGKCDWIAERAHKYGGKVIQTVVTEKHALAAQKQGADAVQLTGNEAAAHGGQATTFCLIPSAREKLDIPIVAIGGIANGKGMAAAMALGADGVGMGTRLATTIESPLHENTKQLHLDAQVEDTLFSNRFDGLWCRVLDTPSAQKSIRKGMNLFKAALVGPRIARDLNLPLVKVMMGIMAEPQKMTTLAHMATAFDKIRAATEDGDFKKGVGLVGQCTGIINDIPTCKDVIDRTIKEAIAVSKNLAATIK
jgi:NAD(P)H-dependent flavin oxidoreductase YrpB (nitropropane dioxygenase family)